MCIICVDMAKGTLKPKEASRALGEMVEKIGREHAAEVKKKIAEEEERLAKTSP